MHHPPRSRTQNRRSILWGFGALSAAVVVSQGPSSAMAVNAKVASPSQQYGGVAHATPHVKVVVRSSQRETEGLVRAVRAVGGRVTRNLSTLSSVAAEIPPGSLPALRATPGVASVTRDRIALPTQTSMAVSAVGAASDVHTLTGVSYEIKADAAWAQGFEGNGVDVAVVDTGVSPVPGLARRIVANVDFSSDAQNPALRNLDAYGHGTHIAGIIAAKADGGQTKGVAPKARIVNVKIGAANGMTSTSAMVSGIDWIIKNGRKNGLNVRVINISYAAPPSLWLDDPVAMAVGAANEAGFIVVASAGNDATGRLGSPAYQPDIISVAAIDQGALPGLTDNTVAPFSSAGLLVRPTLGAPGTSIASLVVPGSLSALAMPAARVGTGYIKATGTSQSAAVVSGAAALLAQKWPKATPLQIKQILASSAVKVGGDGKAQGAGMIQLDRALATPLPEVSTTPTFYATTVQVGKDLQGLATSDALATYASRATNDKRFITPYASSPTDADASAITAATPWSGMTWSGMTWSGTTWSGMTWSGMTWSGMTWSGMTWSGMTWSGMSWSSSIWG